MSAPLSVVIPTLNAASALPETCESLLAGATDGLIRELVMSDGGSTDETRSIARELGAIWIEGPPGRGQQIARGVTAANAPWVLIVHADTHLEPGWIDETRRHMSERPDMAGYFRLGFRADGIASGVVAWGANTRSRLFGLPYGDQGLLVSRDVLDAVGGVPEIPLMEDVALARRLRGKLRMLGCRALTSAERYQRDGWIRRSLGNLILLLRYRLGASPERLARMYRG